MDERVSEPPSRYWSEYTNLQRVKHDLIRHYLHGWFPKMTHGGARRVVYFDTHAGRGRHEGGQLGSPLIALRALLEHKSRDRMLARSEVHFFFIEIDQENVRRLKRELGEYQPLPERVCVRTEHGNCFAILEEVITSLRGASQRMAPSFVFCDPCGFKIPGRTLRRLMQFPRVELFVNVIWRELDMAIRHGQAQRAGWQAVLDEVFGGPGWRQTIVAEGSDERAEQCVALIRRLTQARWATYIRMLGVNQKTRYFLLHLTNHPAGRELMKECMWRACPEEGYFVRRTDDPKQQYLIQPEPDLRPLRQWLVRKLASRPSRWQDLLEDVREEIWLPTHLNEVIRQLRNEGSIRAEDYSGRCTPKNDPLLRLCLEQGRPKP